MTLKDHVLIIDLVLGPLIVIGFVVLGIMQVRHGHYIKDIHVHFNGKDGDKK